MTLFAPTEQDSDELFSLDDALQRSEAITQDRCNLDGEPDAWSWVEIDGDDEGDAEWVAAQPIDMHDLAIMCGDAP